MATLYAKTAGGNWSAAGTWSNTGSGGGDSSGPPTAADDVIFEAGSGAVTISSAAVCRSLNCTSGTGNYTGTLTQNAAIGLSIGDATAGAGNVALKLSSGMTFIRGDAVTSIISFVSTSATVQTIDTAGKTMGSWTVNGAGSSYQLTSSITMSTDAVTTLTAGTLDTNSQACILGFLSSSNSNTRTLTLGASAISITGTGNTLDFTTSTGLTITANTAVMTAGGANLSLLATAAIDFNGMTLAMNNTFATTLGGGSGAFALTFGNLLRTPPVGKTSTFVMSSNIIVTGTLTLAGSSATNRFLASSNTPGVARTLTAANIGLSNVDFMDITAAGVAAPFTGVSLGNALGNTNITTDTPVTRYAVAAGNWSATATWSASDGGASGASVPLCHDAVILNGNSGTGTIVADMPRMASDITCTGYAGTLSFASTPNTIYGSVTLGSGMIASGTQALTLGARSSKTFTSAGIQYPQAITVMQTNGTYTLADAFSTAGAFTQTGLSTLTTAGFGFTCLSFAAGASAVTNMGASTWSLTGTSSFVFTHGGTLVPGTSNLVIATVSASSRTVSIGVGRSLATLTYTVAGSTGGLTLASGLNTIGTINFSDASNARTLTLPASTTTFTGSFNVNGTPGNLMSVISASSGVTATISKTGVVNCTYLSLKDSTATGGASWYAGLNSTVVSNVSGWFLTEPTNAVFFPFFQST